MKIYDHMGRSKSFYESVNESAIKKPKVSVIVPVWNPGPGILRCIESLQSQTLEDIEIIFVDDCGTDDSIEKVRKAATGDSRIRILKNEENIGAGPSRNKGIAMANGVYLSFIDPDDYVETDFFEKLYEKAETESLDIAKGTAIYEKEDGTTVRRDMNLGRIIRTGIEQEKPLFILFTYEHHSAIYRREMIIANGIRYGSSRRAQDTTFLLSACLHAKRFALVDEAFYHFCERSDSAMHTINAEMLMAIADAFGEHVDTILFSGASKEYAIEYVLSKVRSYLREPLRYEAANYSDGQMEASNVVQRFSEEMATQLKRLPFFKDIAVKNFSVQVLLEYGELLPQSPYVSPWDNLTCRDWRALSKKWVSFLASHPECRSACKRDVKIILLRALIPNIIIAAVKRLR